MTTIGNFIKMKREQKGMGQREVCRLAGVNETWIYQVEKGKQRTSLEFVECVFDVLGTSLTEYDSFKKEGNMIKDVLRIQAVYADIKNGRIRCRVSDDSVTVKWKTRPSSKCLCLRA